MGTDNLFHKRKAKSREDLERRRASRETYEKVLIVSEGEKTEPLYFEDIKNYYKLSTANIRVSGECGSDPMSVVEHGLQLYRTEKDKGDTFDRVYIVIDRDKHENYLPALEKIGALKPAGTFFPITSVPCFEYWILLHFVYTTKSFNPTGTRSSGGAVLVELKKYFPDYEKAMAGVFSKLIGQLEQAKAFAARAASEAEKQCTDNPTTRIHELVHYLQHLKDPQE